MYRLINGDWKISEHHSSAMPEPIAAVEEAAAELELVGEKPGGGQAGSMQVGRSSGGRSAPGVLVPYRPVHACTASKPLTLLPVFPSPLLTAAA